MLLIKCGSQNTFFIISHIIGPRIQWWDGSGIPVGTQAFPKRKSQVMMFPRAVALDFQPFFLF